MVYRFYLDDLIATLPESSRTIKYHFCDKKYEVTADLDRSRAQDHGRLLDLVCAGPLLRQEAEPLLYDHFKFIVTLRQHWAPLDLSEGDRYMLSHASSLEIHLSSDRLCRFMPPHHQKDDRSLCHNDRRISWDGASSLTPNNFQSPQPLQLSRPPGRRGSWSGPDQSTPYIDRLDALFDALGRGINIHLKNLKILIVDITHRYDDGAVPRLLHQRIFQQMLRHIEARVRLKPEGCVAKLYLDRRIGELLSFEFVLKFLDRIQ